MAYPATIGGMTSRVHRSFALDVVRVVGMLAIIAGHVWVAAHPLRELLYSWHVPVFFVLTGYLWKRRPFRAEVRSRTKSLLVPYFAWLVILCVSAIVGESMSHDVHPENIAKWLWGGQEAAGPPFWPIWFVTALFAAALVYVWLSRIPLPWQWVGASLLLVVAVYAPGQPAQYLPLSIGLALPGVVFIVAGATLRRYRDHITRPVPVAVLLLCLGLAAAGLRLTKPLDMKHLDLGTTGLSAVVACIISAGLILLAEGLFDGSERKGAIVTRLAQSSLVVLFLHTAIIVTLRVWGVPKPVVFAVTVVVAWGVGLLLLRVPRAWVLTGVVPERMRAAAN
jgi:acyltransferase